MSIRKKVVWLPYDMDTAIGINNSGLLVFSYNLEDIDTQQGGEFIFNGQDSVMWTNLRDAFGPEIRTMYQNLRSSGALSYDRIEKMFEDHQIKWSEAIFNEDAYFKYIEPLINPDPGKQPTADYLPMAQGSKTEQRKWWLYNRFRYMDSKWNAGDALTDYIMMRAYAVDDITLTPYADIYLTTAWDGELTQVRAERGQTYILPCPKDSANDAVVAIYSASQLSSIGDLSGLKIKSGNFSMATQIQDLKVGDGDSNYSNTNLTNLQLGNNKLLRTLDVRNCPNLAITVDVSGCSNIEEIYFDGTGIAGVVLPNGGILNTLHLPDTVTNLTILNQPNLSDFVLNDSSNISTLRLENAGILMDNAKNLIQQIDDNARIRLIGIDWQMEDEQDLKNTFNKIDSERGIDEQGGNTTIAQLSGTVYSPIASISYYNRLQNRYPYVNFIVDELTNLVKQFLEGSLTTYEDEQLTVLGDYAFAYKDTIESVNLPNVTTAGMNLFLSCSNLKVVNLPNLTNEIKAANGFNNMFQGCSSLEEIVLNKPGYISQGMFSGCTSLRKVSMTNAVDVYSLAFNDCINLVEVDLPKCKLIRGNIFKSCNALKNLKFLSHQDNWGQYGDPIRLCISLEYIYLSDISGFRSPSNSTLFEGCNALKGIILSGEFVTLQSAYTYFPNWYDGSTPNLHFYVPRDLISSYQTATNWSGLYAEKSDIFRILEDYTVDGTTTGDIDDTKV